MTKHQLQKPDFSIGGPLQYDGEFFPASVREACMTEFRRSWLTAEQQHQLLVFISANAKLQCTGDMSTDSELRDQLDGLAAAAHALQIAINKLNSSAASKLRAETVFLVRGIAPPHALPATVLHTLRAREHHLGVGGPGGLLDTAFDWAAALEISAEHAIEHIHPTKNGKPKEIRARRLVTLLAQWVRDKTGRPPPKDSAAWFAGVVAHLGSHLELDIGARLIASGIEATH